MMRLKRLLVGTHLLLRMNGILFTIILVHFLTGYYKNQSKHPWKLQDPSPQASISSSFCDHHVSCQGEATKMAGIEMSYLWAMTPEGEGIPDWIEIFVEQCLKVRDSTSGNLSTGA